MNTVTLTAADNGREISVRVGDVISVSLSDNPTTGYRWRIASIDEKALTRAGDEFHGEGSGVGTGGTATWTFTARHPSTTRLEFAKSRSWQQESPTERFSIDLKIAA